MEQVGIIAWPNIVIAVAAALTVVILCVAAGFAWYEVRCIEKARKAQLLTDLSRRWDEEPLLESRRALRTYKDKDGCKLWRTLKYLDKKNHEQYYVLLIVANFYEDLAVLIKEKCFGLELVKNILGGAIRYYYDLYEVSIRELRKEYQDQSIYENFEDLAKKVSD